MNRITQKEKDKYIYVAKQLLYPQVVIDKLNMAETAMECDRIMKQERIRLDDNDPQNLLLKKLYDKF